MSELVLDLVTELAAELLMMFVFSAVALLVSARMLRARVRTLRLLMVAAVVLVLSIVIGDVARSALALQGIARSFVEGMTHVAILAAAMVAAARVSVAKAAAVAVVTGILRFALMWAVELLWVLYLFATI